MSFFDDVPPPPPPPQPPPREHKPWQGAPPGWIGGWVPWRFNLVKTSDCLAVVNDVEAFPTGVSFTLVVRLRPDPAEEAPPRGGPPMMRVGSQDGPLFGVGFADGRKAVLGRRPREEEPTGPLLVPSGGSGTTRNGG